MDDDEISYDGNLLSSSHPVGMYVSNNVKCEMLKLYENEEVIVKLLTI